MAPSFADFIKYLLLLGITRLLKSKSVFFLSSSSFWFLVETNTKDKAFLVFNYFNYFCNLKTHLKINEVNANKIIDK